MTDSEGTSSVDVLVVAPHLPPSHIGGVETYAQSLIDSLVARGQRVQSASVERVSSGAMERCDCSTTDDGGSRSHRLSLTVRRGARFRLRVDHPPTEDWFDELFARRPPDVVHLQSGYLLGAPLLRAAARQRIPVVLTIHDYWFVCPQIVLQHPGGETCAGPDDGVKCAWCVSIERRRYRWMHQLLDGEFPPRRWPAGGTRWMLGAAIAEVVDRQTTLRALFRQAAAVLAPSRFLIDQVAAAGFPVDHAVVSRCGIVAPPRCTAPPGPGLRLAYFGQVVPHKGVHVVLEAMRELPDRDIQLTVHGPLPPGAYADRLRGLAAADSRVTLCGAYSRDELPELLRAAHAVVVPSLWPEVAALVIQEAQGAGVPVIASCLGGSPEFVTDGVDGLLFDPRVPGALTGQLRRALDDRALLDGLRGVAPVPRTIADEIDALLPLYAAVRGSR